MNQQNQVSPPAKGTLQDEDLEKKLNEIKKLEVELKNTKDEKLKGELRKKLCVSAADLIIGTPGVALENKICGRLWNSCFYTHIKGIQNAMFRESTRKRRKKEANGKNDTNSPDERLNKLNATLKNEIADALKLYEYIIDKYEGKLRALEEMKESDRICIVPIYFKLLIHSGDLHRYHKNFPKAEVCYRKASQLAPGHGNPFNQLAVVSQSYDTAKTCEALYWYMRSLLVTFERFQTTPKNLLSLLKNNKHWIANNPLQVLDTSNNRGKKPFGEKQKQQKQAATRHFFAKFIDLTSCFVPKESLSSRSSSKPKKGEEHDESKELLEVKKSADFVINNFRSFVKDRAFSDALLIKMIVINASSYILANKSNFILVLSFGNLFASVLADHVLSNIAYVHGGNPDKPMSSIKAFTPLLLWCEWFGSLDADEFLTRINKYPNDLFHRKANRNFFDKISSLAKELQGHDTSLADDSISLKEHDHLRGFKPFVSFIDHTPKASYFPGDAKDNSPEKGYLISSEAAQVLQQSSSFSSTSNEQETANRIYRFLEFSSRCKFTVWDDDANQYVHKKIDIDGAAEAEDDFEENVVFNAGTGLEDGIVTDTDSDTAGQNSIETGEILEDKTGNNNNDDDDDGALNAEEEEGEEDDDDDDEEADEIVYTGIQNHKKLPQAYQAQPSAPLPAPAPAPEKQQTFSVRPPSVSKPTFTTNNNDLPLPPQETMKKAAAAPLTSLESISLPTPPTKENNKSLLLSSSSALDTPKTNHHQVTTLLPSISTTGPPPGYNNNNMSSSFQAPPAPAAQKKLPPPPGFGSTSSTTPLTSGPVSGFTTFTNNINTNNNNGTSSDAPNPGFSFMTSSSLSNELPLPPPQNNSVLPKQQQQVVTKNRLSSFPALNDDDNGNDASMENYEAIRTGTGIGRTIESNNNKNDTTNNPYIGMESHNPFLGVGIDFSKVLYLNDQRYECKQQNKTTNNNNNTNDIYNIDLSSSAVANSFLFGNPSSSSSLLSSLDNKSMNNNNNNAREQQQKSDVINPFEASWNPFLRREMR
eukprot:CAMPEP_0178968924 /NCGR_PEP_ID=MMETSP0789-20121207/18540_1 /TAXON_ID=3005 /ORGANISM="Rhizosolenia setigera, Strain CCMP 1694" /LENGTH=1041 /DNA_ID=CAMNT_0020654939 /DNA_START=204 /DNA_END=3329 /DNA_ORIENTATION=+